MIALAPSSTVAQSASPTNSPGRIEGAVVLSRSVSQRKPRIRLYADYGPGAYAVPTSKAPDERANVIVYLDSAPDVHLADSASQAHHPGISQRHETFVPHVLPVLLGQTVDFPNDDPVFHNVFSLSSTRSFDLGRYPHGTSKSVRFQRPGVVQIFCHIHSDMSAVVLVLSNPFFAVPAAGHYVIDSVPPGVYRLVAWHERIRPAVRRVNVTAGQTTVVDFDIPLPVDSAAR